MPLVAGVDSSTQSCKVEIRDADTGAVVARASAPHPPVHPPRSEQHPDSWWSAFTTAWQAAGAPDVQAISVAGQQHGLVALGAGGHVLRPAKLWNDTESAADAAWLVKKLPGGAKAWAEASGSVPRASFTVTKLSWLHRSEPTVWADLRHVLLPHDWLTWRLTGRMVTDRGDASGTGYWSPSQGSWRADLLALVDAGLDWAPLLPEVLGPVDAAGTWNGAVVGPGSGDNMAAALGLGLAPGEVGVSIGTSGTVFAPSTHSTADASGAVAGFADATGAFLPLVCTLNAARVTDTMARLLGVDHERFDALALEAPPGAGGLTLLPYLDGERTPDRPSATGTVHGLRSDTSRELMARAAVEGVVCGLLDGLDALYDAGVAVGHLVLTGGGARSAAYRRVLADLSGQPVVVRPADEAVAAGAAVQAAAVLHGRPPGEVAAAWQLGGGTVVEPTDIDREAVRRRYADLRDAMA